MCAVRGLELYYVVSRVSLRIAAAKVPLFVPGWNQNPLLLLESTPPSRTPHARPHSLIQDPLGCETTVCRAVVAFGVG